MSKVATDLCHHMPSILAYFSFIDLRARGRDYFGKD